MVTRPGSVAVFLLAVHVAVGGALVNFCDADHPSDPHGSHKEDEDEAGQRQGGAAADHVDEEADERVEQQRGPEEPVDQRPGPARGHHGRLGEGARAAVLLLEGVLLLVELVQPGRALVLVFGDLF